MEGKRIEDGAVKRSGENKARRLHAREDFNLLVGMRCKDWWNAVYARLCGLYPRPRTVRISRVFAGSDASLSRRRATSW